MKEERIEYLVKTKQIVKKTFDKGITKSLLNSSKNNAEVILSIPLNEKNATIILRELYESIRQLGEAMWWLKGYAPQSHDVSLEILKEIDFLKDTQKVKLNYLDRFKTIRHDANYRGFKVSEAQTKEIIEFWNNVAKEILSHLEKQLA